MPIPLDEIENAASGAMLSRLGPAVINWYAFLMFGGGGFSGFADEPTLAGLANSFPSGGPFTEEAALSFTNAALRVGLASRLQAVAANDLVAAGLTADQVVSAVISILTGSVSSPFPTICFAPWSYRSNLSSN